MGFEDVKKSVSFIKGRKVVKSKKVIIVVVLGVFIILVATKVVSALSSSYSNNKGLYFSHLINYTLPVVTSTSLNSEDLLEENKSLEEKFWDVIGVDINSPITLLSKEIPLLDAKEIEVLNPIDQDVNPFQLSESNILNEPVVENNVVPVTLDANKPAVLIYHSHTTESYMPTKNDSTDETMNVCAVGDGIEYELEKTYGISTIHDKTIHDAFGYLQSYSKSRATVNKYLKQYGSFKLIIDLHRDSSSNKKNDIVIFNKENVAKCMFVMCKQGPYASENMAIANKLTSIGNTLIPNFFRKTNTDYNKGNVYFNQDLSSNSLLLEVGTNLNSVTETKNSSKYIAKIISEYLKGK